MKNEPKKKIWHCSDSNIPAHDDISVIDSWHEKRDFKTWDVNGNEIHVGYHKFIQRNGNVQNGRPLSIHGAACKGHNSSSIQICLSGKSGKFTEAQLYSARLLNDEIDEVYGKLPNHNHGEFDDEKDFCAGLDLKILT